MENEIIKKESCPICDIPLSKSQSYRGPTVTFSNEIKIKKFNFLRCSSCGYSLNKNYDNIDFDNIKYNNYQSLVDNESDNIVEENIIYYKSKYFKNDNITLIELGPGNRLELLEKLNYRLKCKTYAIDPLYKKNINEFSSSEIIHINSIEKLPVLDENVILIARNMIEYLSTVEMSYTINKLFDGQGLIFFEFQPRHSEKWGSIFSFTEYKAFYTTKSIEQLIKKTNRSIKMLASSYLFGEERQFLSGYIYKEKTNNKVTYNISIKDLCRKLTIEKSKKKRIILWGASGRGLMFLYNEGSDFIDEVIDSSPQRQGLFLPEFGAVKNPSSLKADDIIVLLNSRYLDYIMTQLKYPSVIHTIGIS